MPRWNWPASPRLLPAGAAPADRLARAKRTATGVLIACVLLAVASRLMIAQWPAMAYLAAFSEAAVIGGLADWYAVVAIFKRPLGLPLPHTAIIPRERDKIADRLGAFIEDNFLGADVIEARLEKIDFVGAARNWLRDPANAGHIAGRIVAAAPFILDAVEKSGLRDDVLDRLARRLASVDARRAASTILRSRFVVANRGRLLDMALAGVLKILSSPNALGDLREAMRREMPALLKLSGGDHAVFRKIVLSVAGYVESVRGDPDHALHRDFDALMDAVVEEIETSPEAGRTLAALRDELVGAAPIETLGRHAFASVRRLVDDQAETFARTLGAGLAEAMPRVAAMLDVTDEQSARLNRTLRATIAGAVAGRRKEIGDFVAAQVRSWDVDDMVAIVETNIGPDLQFIRMNGAVVGGIAGLTIFALSQALGAH